MTFATRESIATTHAESGDAPVITLPSGIVTGDLLSIILGARAVSVNALTGWTSFAQSGGSNTDQRSFWREADGTEGSTVTASLSASAFWSSVAYRFSGTEDPDTQPPEATTDFLDSDSATKTPTSLTPTGGAKDYTWIAVFFHRSGGTVSTFPTNYINTGSVTSGSGNLSGFADRQLNAASETPGTFTTSNSADWSVVTIAIHPAAAAGANPKGPLGMPLHGPFGGPIG